MVHEPGDEAEFGTFVVARSAALQRTAFLLVGDWGLAEDLVQTTLVKTFLAWRRLGAPVTVEAYARKVMVNTAIGWWRRRWRGERPTAVVPDRVSPDRTDDSAERDRVWRLIKELPRRQRAVLVLRYYEDLTEAETARLLDISIGTVKSQSSRALATLRRRLSEPDPTHAADTVTGGNAR